MSASIASHCDACGAQFMRPETGRRRKFCSTSCARSIDLKGKRVGRWLFLERAGFDHNRHALWRARCECGLEHTASGILLRRDHVAAPCDCIGSMHRKGGGFRLSNVPLNKGCTADTLKKRFWEKVNVDDPNECWVWTAGVNQGGYGLIGTSAGVTTLAHRLSWVFANGPITSAEILVCHRCDNPPCVNPAHLFLGDHRDNAADMVAKNRQAKHLGERNVRSKLNENMVRLIRERAANGDQLKSIAAAVGIDRTVVCRVVSRKAWAHVV